jgi:iron complex transport system substrate-binding protein
LVDALDARLATVKAATANVARPRVLCLEWLDPAWIAGHWMPEVVEMAGGTDVLGAPGERSRRATWDEIEAAQPDVAVVMPCGFGLEAALEASDALAAIPQLLATPAFRAGRTYVVDASSYYSRSGPRIVDGVELMASILHPEIFGEGLPAEAARRVQLAPAEESLSPR